MSDTLRAQSFYAFFGRLLPRCRSAREPIRVHNRMRLREQPCQAGAMGLRRPALYRALSTGSGWVLLCTRTDLCHTIKHSQVEADGACSPQSRPPLGAASACTTAAAVGFAWVLNRSGHAVGTPFSCQGSLAWGLSSLCALFPPGEAELLPAPSPSSPTRIPLRITPPLSRSFDSPYATPARNERKNRLHDDRLETSVLHRH